MRSKVLSAKGPNSFLVPWTQIAPPTNNLFFNNLLSQACTLRDTGHLASKWLDRPLAAHSALTLREAAPRSLGCFPVSLGALFPLICIPPRLPYGGPPSFTGKVGIEREGDGGESEAHRGPDRKLL